MIEYEKTAATADQRILITNEYVKVKRIVKEIDPDAFVIITGASEVLGKGFQRLDQN